MTLEGVEYSQSKKGKERVSRKLQVGEKVEVRSIDDGFEGSWHPGEVICCEELTRHVKYENVLDDGGVNYLEEAVTVSEVLDGNIECDNCYERGWIRPLPPLVDFEKGDLKFGLCVDVNHKDAWWEGVIFDHCDGMEKRCVFFPDIGDEMQVGISDMRITQDWEEVTEEWMQRGKWVFLELVEKWESKLLITVSAKQIWYDVRIKKEFDKIGEWTCNMEFLWKDLVKEVVNDYFSLTVKEVLLSLNLSGILLDELPELDFVEAVANVEENLPQFRNQNGPCGADYAVVPGASAFEETREHGSLRSNGWKHLKFTEVEPCPDAVKEYLLAHNRETKAFWKNKLQKHLVYLGWKIDLMDKYKGKRYRYNVPEKLGQKYYLSLIEVCRVMKKDPDMSFLQLQNDQGIVHPTVDCHISDLPLNPSEDIQNPVILPPTVLSSPVEDEPEFCPEAVEHYYQSHISNKSRAYKKEWIVKAKKHLLAVGWIFDYPPPDNKKRGIIYISPQNQRFPTLHAACRFCLEETNLSDVRPVNVSVMNEENVAQVQDGELVGKPSQLLPKDTELQSMDGAAASRVIANQKQKRLRDSKANTPKCQRPLRVLRSDKKIQKVSTTSPLHHKPLNILSCLIENNIVLPRSKVYYKVKGRQRAGRATRALAVGRISHDGIKCNCCQKTCSIFGFASHANGSSTCRPSASIFLDGDKSLLDCQIQMMQCHKTREISRKSLSDFSLAENDFICSVCQYGGDLILCDQCPSSFHKTCLGLEDIPDGDWFCPSCRCGTCGQRKIDGDEDENFLTCIQCEHKYHIRCLKSGSVVSRYLGNWFCGEDCEKIYEGLQKLLGEPVSVGVDNLTWTLVKFIDPDSCDLGSIKSDLMAESYSKLKLALSVMHECFEPLKESLTGRDLVEDVIFSRRSELNRLNFQGFYTVILERNEELISVATVRVYGKKVAELPLVGTRLQYRRHGMCRILINELEKMLKKLHVERLVLPAVPSVIETWTGSFGFAKMTDSERSQFLSYTFLDFQGTMMCQKLLMDISVPDSVLLIESQSKCDVSSGSCCVNFSMSGSVCEAYRVEETDKEVKVALQSEETCAGKNGQIIVAIDPVMVVDQSSHGDQQLHNGTTSSQSSIDKRVDRNSEPYKFFYSRRKMRKTCEE